MQYTLLPNTDLKISKLCLGTMTWGEQNNEADAHAQIKFALEKGINFIDTAEMYPIPAQKETQGSTETFLGNWFAKNGNREKIILASKIAGPNRSMSHIREKLDFKKESLEIALNKSLKRLQTDYLDLYQLHWPERNTNYFGQLGYSQKEEENWQYNFSGILDQMERFVKQGKIRHFGISNESPFGVMRFLEEARNGKMKIVSLQNPYNLLNRKDEIGMTEILHRENLGYLPYSPLGFGQLTGKYLDNKKPANARITLFPHYTRYQGANTFRATKEYNEIAKKHNIGLSQMAIAFICQQPFVTAPILGATSVAQLSENIGSLDLKLSQEIIKEINAVQHLIPNPAP